jgi:hypothetical protein
MENSHSSQASQSSREAIPPEISDQIGQLLKHRLICGGNPKSMGIQTSQGWDGKAFEEHLASCETCHRFVRSLLADEDLLEDSSSKPPVGRPSPLRKVRLLKVRGKDRAIFSLGEDIEGWELWEPRVGRSYIIKLENGRYLRTSPIRRLTIGGFETVNSTYLLEAIPFNL